MLRNHDSLIEGLGPFVYPNGFDSDQLTVCFALKKTFNRPTNSTSLVYQYDKADFDGIRNTFSHILWDHVLLFVI